MRQVPEGAPDTQHLVEDSVAVNRAVWTTMNAQYTDARARAAWQQSEITWGIWQVPEVKLRA
ncbi:MAG: hypothetical protein JOZ81_01200, partial [Chloroflexi bacterium]|nr:hypothetical protein [Chloroflexota bacterium]